MQVKLGDSKTLTETSENIYASQVILLPFFLSVFDFKSRILMTGQTGNTWIEERTPKQGFDDDFKQNH